jgi:putative membrane protein (TIGR04086 family)
MLNLGDKNMNQYTEISGNNKKDSGKPGFQGASYSKLAKSVILGTIAGVFSSVVFMIIFAVVINAVFGDPDSVLKIFTCIAACAGASAGGFYASRINGSRGFISGITTGFIISLVILTVMMFGGKSPSESTESSDIIFKLIIILCQIIFACAGGIFAANSNKSKRTVRTYPIGKKK